jgi:hypothetical protein
VGTTHFPNGCRSICCGMSSVKKHRQSADCHSFQHLGAGCPWVGHSKLLPESSVGSPFHTSGWMRVPSPVLISERRTAWHHILHRLRWYKSFPLYPNEENWAIRNLSCSLKHSIAGVGGSRWILLVMQKPHKTVRVLDKPEGSNAIQFFSGCGRRPSPTLSRPP